MIRWLLVLALLPACASAEIYRCGAEFSDTPCAEDARRVTLEPVNISSDLAPEGNIEFYEPSPAARSSASAEPEPDPDPCPHISSTKLNTLVIKNLVVSGMKPGDVQDSWGSPNSILTREHRTQWAYHYEDGSAQYVHFQHGCVSSTSTYARY